MEKQRQHGQRLHSYPNQGVSDLWQLFEGPSQFKEFGDVAALRVILTGAPRLYKKTGFLLLRCNVKLYKPPPPPSLPSRQDEWNSMKNFALLAVFTMASIPSSSIQALSTLRFTSVPGKYMARLLA